MTKVGCNGTSVSKLGGLEHQSPLGVQQHRRTVQTWGSLFVSLVRKLEDAACSNATSVGAARIGSRKPSEMQRAVAGLIQDEVSMHIKRKYDSIRGHYTSNDSVYMHTHNVACARFEADWKQPKQRAACPRREGQPSPTPRVSAGTRAS